MSELNKPWTWNDDVPKQPDIHPVDAHPPGTRFLACGYDAELKPFGQGDWVRYSDYARLQSEVERLTVLQVEAVDERNKAETEVERLTKAGDAMAEVCGWDFYDDSKAVELINNWEAAKERKDNR